MEISVTKLNIGEKKRRTGERRVQTRRKVVLGEQTGVNMKQGRATDKQQCVC